MLLSQAIEIALSQAKQFPDKAHYMDYNGVRVFVSVYSAKRTVMNKYAEELAKLNGENENE